MSTQEFENHILNSLECLENEEGESLLEQLEMRSAHTFEDLGLLTRNHGLVIQMQDGSEFQLTIVKSRD